MEQDWLTFPNHGSWRDIPQVGHAMIPYDRLSSILARESKKHFLRDTLLTPSC